MPEEVHLYSKVLTIQLVLNDSKQTDAALNGLAEISTLIPRQAVVEDLYLNRVEHYLKATYHKSLTDLYTKILEFQATAACNYNRNTLLRGLRSTLQLDDWSKLLQEVKTKDVACNELMHVFDSMDQKSGTLLLHETLRQQDPKWKCILCSHDPNLKQLSTRR
jgi:hypothetical protein